MASTSKAHPSIQRINKAYVQVPTSPLSLTSYHPLKTPIHTALSAKLKENTPLPPLQFSTNPRKRKLSDSIHDVSIFAVKKSKPVAVDGTPSKIKAPRSQPVVPTANACPDFPNGYVYCHQCSRKRDILTTIQCNVVKHQQIKRKGTVERPCTNKYCKNCLKRKYNEDLDVLQSCTNAGGAAFFTCPRCRGVCDCPKCKKLLAIEATGPPGPHHNALVGSKTTKSENKSRVQNSTRTKVEAVVIPTKKVLPQLKWTPVSYIISQVQAEERIFIREFALRFGHIMKPTIAKSSLEELEFIAGKTKNNDDDDDLLAWVSEVCLKGLILGLLGLLAKDHEVEVAKEIKTAIETIRSAGVNLNKIWLNLVALRDDVANLFSSAASTSDAQPLVWVPLTFPDPLPAPLSVVQGMRSLRNMKPVAENIVNVVLTAQMIPVIISLIHSVLETAVVREEIDQGVRDARDIARDAKEAIRIENERWEKERKDTEDVSKKKVDKNEDNTQAKAHKDRISNINNVVKLTTHCFTPRFSILGTDNEGRTYYALSPGTLEREVAFEYLEVIHADKARKLKKKGPTLEDRSEMKEWSWFISVWGKKPVSEGQTKNPQFTKKRVEDDADISNEKEDGEKWWGFWEPEEIVKVADWIFIKSELEGQETQAGRLEDSTFSQTKKDPAKVRLKHLVTQLKDYAALLEWRARDNKFSIGDAPVSEQTSNGKGKKKNNGTISAETFDS